MLVVVEFVVRIILVSSGCQGRKSKLELCRQSTVEEGSFIGLFKLAPSGHA
jgi:hypothetical protein